MNKIDLVKRMVKVFIIIVKDKELLIQLQRMKRYIRLFLLKMILKGVKYQMRKLLIGVFLHLLMKVQILLKKVLGKEQLI